MEALYTTHDELSHLLDRYKQSLSTENEPTAEIWRSIRTGQRQAVLAASKKILPWFFAYDRQKYTRYM